MSLFLQVGVDDRSETPMAYYAIASKLSQQSLGHRIDDAAFEAKQIGGPATVAERASELVRRGRVDVGSDEVARELPRGGGSRAHAAEYIECGRADVCAVTQPQP